MKTLEIAPGDIVRLVWVKSYQHGATIQINKINQHSFNGVELDRSYMPNRKWNIHKNSNFSLVKLDENGKYLHNEYWTNGVWDYNYVCSISRGYIEERNNKS